MLTCKDAARLLAQDRTGASTREIVTLRLHLLMCRFCRRYRSQLRAIGEGCRNEIARIEQDPAALERLERTILDHRRS